MARPKYPSDDLAQFMLRMPPDMRDRIKKVAEENNRSMNAEILARLEQSENVIAFLSEFQLLKESNISLQKERDELRKQWKKLGEIAGNAQEINRQLIELLMRKLDATEEEITAITRPKR